LIGNPSRLVIRRRFARLTAAELAPFQERSTSFVVDAMNGRGALRSPDQAARPPKRRFVGSALTARAGARDNLAALAELDLIEPGDVLVIATQGFTGTATLGDMARIAQLRGAVALVTDGMVRDASEIITLGMPCFCRGVTPNSAFPSGPGEVGLPIALGEVMLDAGDLVIGDPDGVAVVPRAALAEVTRRLEQVATKEVELHARIASGRIPSLIERAPALNEQITYVD
jgi:4-hydroxy-4-methyl-2-oxoglutarate aldolase